MGYANFLQPERTALCVKPHGSMRNQSRADLIFTLKIWNFRRTALFVDNLSYPQASR